MKHMGSSGFRMRENLFVDLYSKGQLGQNSLKDFNLTIQEQYKRLGCGAWR